MKKILFICPNSIKPYLDYVNGIELLSLKEETELLERVLVGDKKAKNILIEHNLGLVIYVIKQFNYNEIELDDLIQIGNIALMKAVDNFDFKKSKGCRFSTFAVTVIKNEFRKVISDYQKKARCNEKINANSCSILLDDFDYYCEDDIMYDQEYFESHIRNFYNLLPYVFKELLDDNNLSNRQRMVLTLVLGFDNKGPKTFAMVGKMLKISDEAVRQYYNIALEKLRNYKTLCVLYTFNPLLKDCNFKISNKHIKEDKMFLNNKIDNVFREIVGLDYFCYFGYYAKKIMVEEYRMDNKYIYSTIIDMLYDIFNSLSYDYQVILKKLFGEELNKVCYKDTSLSFEEKIILVYGIIPMIKDYLRNSINRKNRIRIKSIMEESNGIKES